MKQTLLIVDDFYDDPMTIRRGALLTEYPDHGGKAYFAGRNSRRYLINDGIVGAVSRLVGYPLAVAPDMACGHFRISLASDRGRSDVHTDPGVDWSGVLYLNLPGQCRGGTSFYRHRRLGLDGVPLDQAEARRLGFSDRDHLRSTVIAEDSLDRSKWERTLTVPMRFNRLILFRPWLWHTAAENFGDSMETGRLIQVFFFVEARQAPAS
jgi:hypothetical protein